MVVALVLEAWKEISEEMIIQLFRGFALTIVANGSENHEISCLKPGKSCADDLKMLERQMVAFCDAQQDQISSILQTRT